MVVVEVNTIDDDLFHLTFLNSVLNSFLNSSNESVISMVSGDCVVFYRG